MKNVFFLFLSNTSQDYEIFDDLSVSVLCFFDKDIWNILNILVTVKVAALLTKGHWGKVPKEKFKSKGSKGTVPKEMYLREGI